MRLALPLLFATATLAGCNREKDFDTEFAETQKKLEAEAKRLDAEMKRAKAAEPGEKVPAKKARY